MRNVKTQQQQQQKQNDHEGDQLERMPTANHRSASVSVLRIIGEADFGEIVTSCGRIDLAALRLS